MLVGVKCGSVCVIIVFIVVIDIVVSMNCVC